MKTKLFFVLLMALSLPLVFSSCSKDEDENNSIVGTWKFNRSEAGEVKTNSATNDQIMKEFLKEDMDLGEMEYIFHKDGKFESKELRENGDTESGSYKIENDLITILFEYGYIGTEKYADTMKYNFYLKGNTLILEKNYTNGLNHQTPWSLSEYYGITDPNFKATKVIGRAIFDRQK